MIPLGATKRTSVKGPASKGPAMMASGAARGAEHPPVRAGPKGRDELYVHLSGVGRSFMPVSEGLRPWVFYTALSRHRGAGGTPAPSVLMQPS
jgi:hypothetical protein